MKEASLSKLSNLVEIVQVAESCPQDWLLHGNSCYHIIDTPTAKWRDARATCQNLGGDLAIIRSQDENNFALDLLKKQKTVTYYGAWLGLYRNPSAGDAFYWIDDTPLEGHQFSAWASGQPSHVQEKCGHMYAASDRIGKWNDKECSLSDAQRSKAPVVLCQKRFMYMWS
ncbi:CD209 antigen-like protein A [Orbicella faveolata]|uniref:CD209 antigen-like protein A n=1 Tax=Orbicella faveolata TaxID=48498 RepID=UPI0009E28460|nr:CD209 antigen-like protein A [Orbicella faveolata]